jgi:FkbM family methyltransferase
MSAIQLAGQLIRWWKTRHQEGYWKKSFSQCGEDLLVDYVFQLRGINRPSYLDIGAHHPYWISNSAFFYEKGCRGINIEANPQLIPPFHRYRPEDINLNIGIGNEEGQLDFYVMEDLSLSTLSRQERDRMVSLGKRQAAAIPVRIKTISAVLSESFGGLFPDFLTLDAEGMDLSILRSINFDRHWPKIICVEAAEYSPVGAGARRIDLIDFLSSKNYIEYANTNLNAIMVKREFWDASGTKADSRSFEGVSKGNECRSSR